MVFDFYCRMYSELISTTISEGGPFASKSSLVKLLRWDWLRMFESYTSHVSLWIPFHKIMAFDAVRLRGRHLSWLIHSWTKLKINRRLGNNLFPQCWILYWEIMLGMCLMLGSQKFYHFLLQLWTSIFSHSLFC